MVQINKKTDFYKFQELLKESGLKDENIPLSEYECEYKFDSYDFFQRIKGYVKYTPEEMTLLSKYVPIEKYFWSSAVMFPTIYFSFYDGSDFKDIEELNEVELTTFNKQFVKMIDDVYINQKKLGHSLDEHYKDICSNLLDRSIKNNNHENRDERDE